MLEAASKILMLSLMSCLTVVVPAATAAGAEPSQADAKLQPQGLNRVGVYGLRQIDPALTGSGVRFAVICRSVTYLDGEPQNDYRPSIKHDCFRPGQFRFYDQGELPPGISPHSTAICSILFGEDPDAFSPDLGQFRYQGAVPAAKADVYEFWHFLIGNVFPQSPPDADIVSASIGYQFEDWWTHGIESLAEHHGVIVVAGIGNGSGACDPPLYPGAAANVIGVGVVNSVKTENLAAKLANFSLVYPEHSSWGPTIDGRCKPDIVAPGNCLAAKADDTSGYELTGDWSSFSTPVVAGAVGLLVQTAKQSQDLSLAVSTNGGNCVMKAVLMNSAKKLPYWHKGRLGSDDDHFVPLDYIQGAGMLDAVNAYRHLAAGRHEPGQVPTTGWDNSLLDGADNVGHVYRVAVTEPKGKAISATLVWNRHYDGLYPFEPDTAKDGDLRLELWAVDPDNSDRDYLLDYCDSSIDNVEHIYCRAVAEYTNYEIVVSYGDTPGKSRTIATQRYGLAWNVDQDQNNDDIFWHDLNADGVVNELDYTFLLDNRVAGIESPDSYLLGDINTDGRIDVADLRILLEHNNRQADWHANPETGSE